MVHKSIAKVGAVIALSQPLCSEIDISTKIVSFPTSESHFQIKIDNHLHFIYKRLLWLKKRSSSFRNIRCSVECGKK